MLLEKENVKQVESEGYRRWFFDDYFDLIVWFDSAGAKQITGFQLCYDKGNYERALTWMEQKGFTHTLIDEGEDTAKNKMAPILMPDGIFDVSVIVAKFDKAALLLEPSIRLFIRERLVTYRE